MSMWCGPKELACNNQMAGDALSSQPYGVKLKNHRTSRFFSRGLSSALGLALATVLASCGGGNADSPPAAPVATQAVKTSSGVFQGMASTSGRGTEFRGIQYANATRWQPPQAPTATTDTKIANKFGATCPSVGAPGEAEDCLFLNVYVPPDAKVDAKLPVLVFSHGGGFVAGSGQAYPATSLAAENNMIVVTLNYRLGALGWLSSSKLAAAAASDFEAVGDAGNYGLMDQQFALRWVRDNIAGFGGDPSKVTFSGESAGGMSVVATLTSTNTAQNLFRAAIVQSGSIFYYTSQSAASRQATVGSAFELDLGCDSAACMRSKTVAQVLASQNRVLGRYNLGPVHDTKLVPLPPKTAFESGRFIKVPVMQGVTANEGRFFLNRLLAPLPAPAAMLAAGGPANYDLQQPNAYCGTTAAPAICTYPQLINQIITRPTPDPIEAPYVRILNPSVNTSELVDRLATSYPPANFKNTFLNDAPSADMALAQLWGDAAVACGARAADSALAQYVKVYAFELDDPASPQPSNTVGFPLGSQHTAELNYLYDLGASFNTDQQQLATSMRKYWGNFVAKLDPNGDVIPRFDAFPATQILSPGAGQLRSAADFDQRHFCSSIWDPIRVATP